MRRSIAFRLRPHLYRLRLLGVVLLASCYGGYSSSSSKNVAQTDTIPPSAPANLTATPASTTQIDLGWTAAIDNVGVTGYQVERCQGAGCSNFAVFATPVSNAASDTGLAGATSYSYRVRAQDGAGNLGAYSNVATASTLSAQDTTPPSAPTGLVATPVSSTGIELTWIAASDNVAVTGYWVERCQGVGCSNFAHLSGAASTSFTDTNLTAGTSYSYRVRASDAAGNLGGYSNVASAALTAVSVSVTPRRGGLTLNQTLALTASVANDVGGAGVSWTTSGGSLSGASTTAATFSSAAAGSFTVTATSVADTTKSASVTIGVTDLAGVFTQRYDAQRTGQNPQEYALSANSVSGSTFGKLFSCTVDELVFAQPLYVANLAVGGGTHNTVFVATMNDSVYAFDADASPCVQFWKVSLLNGGTSVSPADTDPATFPPSNDIPTNTGILSTPVIDPATKTMYVVSKTKEGSAFFQRLHALSLVDGTEKFNGPAVMNDAISVPGTADTGDGTTCTSTPGNVPFCALHQNQRPALLLLNGVVYIASASHDDVQPYHGWVIAYPASDLSQPPILFNSTPNGAEGGIWQSGGGPAADSSANIYVMTGNGDFDTAAPRANYGDSFLKLNTAGGLSVADFFTPTDEQAMDVTDIDLGSGGPMVLPDSAGSAAHPRLLIGGDKRGLLYLIDRDNMTKYTPGVDLVLQEMKVKTVGCTFCGIFSTPSFWQGNLYVVAVSDVLKRYSIANAVIALPEAASGGDSFGFPGAQTAVSSSGATNGVVWAVNTSQNGTHNKPNGPAVLFAYDAITLIKLFSSPATGPGAAGNAVKFAVPTVANGKVYVGTQSELSVFGLLP